MRRMSTWALVAGFLVIVPASSSAGLPSFFKLFKGKSQPVVTSASKPKSLEKYNQGMAEKIASALRGAKLAGFDIHIRFQGTKATITGVIADQVQKDKVTRLTAAVAGVKSVENQLILGSRPVAGPAPIEKAGLKGQPPAVATGPRPALPVESSSAERAAAKKVNQMVAEQIARALGQAKFHSFDIGIRFRNGTAQLIGTVATPQAQVLAARIAATVPGVKRVENQLAVGQPPLGVRPIAYQPAPPGPAAPPPVPGPGGPGGPGSGGPGYGPGPMMPVPPSYGHAAGRPANLVHNMPHLPNYAWPSLAAYPNYGQVSYPKQYSASAWPYIGPFYPYPQIPLGWRAAQLEWDDGHWSLNFRPRTSKWWWFINPENW